MVSQAAKDLKRVELAKTILGLSIIVSLLGLALILVDHWVWPLPAFFRWSFLVLTCTLSVFWVLRRLIPMLGRTINPIFAARQIETKVPELKDSLVSYMQLNDSAENHTPKGVVTAIGRFAVDRLSRHDVSEFVSSSTPLRLAIWLFFILVLAAVYFVISPKSGLDSLLRLALPWHTIDAPTRVKIIKVSPQNVVVARGQTIDVEVNLRGVLQSDSVQIEFSSLDGQFVDRKIEMEEVTNGLTYHGMLTMGDQGIVQDLDYRVRAGDAIAGPFRVTLEQMPIVAIEKLELEYPRYTRLAPTQIDSVSSFSAVEGTRVRIYGKSNQAMRSGEIEIAEKTTERESTENKRTHQLLAEKEKISGAFQMLINSKDENPSVFSYRISATSSLGQTTSDPVSHEFKVTKDESPIVQWITEYPETLELPANQATDFNIKASDADFGLSQIKTVLVHGRSKLDEQILLQNNEGLQQPVTRTLRFAPAKLGLRPGDELTLEASAFDNRRDIYDSRWEPNRADSRVIKIKIVAEQKQPTEFSAPPEQMKPLPEQPVDGSDVKPTDDQKSDKSDGDVKEKGSEKDQASEQGASADSDRTAENKDTDNKDAEKDTSDSSTTEEEKNSNAAEKDAPSTEDQQSQEADGSGKPSNDAASDSKDETDASQQQQPKDAQSGNQDENKNSESSDASPGSQSGTQQQQQQQNDAGAEQGDSSSNEQGAGAQSQSGGAGQPSKGQPDKGAGAGSPQNKNDGGSENSQAQGSNGNSGKGNSSNGQKSRSPGAADSQSASGGTDSDDGSSDSDNTGNEATSSSNDGSKSKGGKNSTGKSRSSSGGNSSEPSDDEQSSLDSGDESAKGNDSTGSNSAPQNQASPGNGDKGRLEKVERGNRNPESPMHDGEAFEEIDQWMKEHGDPSEANPNNNNNDNQASQTPNGEQQNQTGSSKPQQGNADKQPPANKGNAAQDNKQGQQDSKAAQDAAAKNNEQSPANGQNSNNDQSNTSQQSGANQAPSGQESKDGQNSSNQQPPSSANSNSANAQNSNGDTSEQSGNQRSTETSSQSGSGPSSGNNANQPGASESSAAPSGAGNGTASTQGSSSENGSGHTNAAPSKANADYAKQVTDLALDYLDRQRDQPDPELLKRLGWTDDELRAFVDRWKKAREKGITPEGNKEYSNELRALGIKPPTTGKRASTGVDDRLSGLNEEGGRSKPPATLQGQYDAFRKAAQQRASKK
jgi:hypothetical protein